MPAERFGRVTGRIAFCDHNKDVIYSDENVVNSHVLRNKQSPLEHCLLFLYNSALLSPPHLRIFAHANRALTLRQSYQLYGIQMHLCHHSVHESIRTSFFYMFLPDTLMQCQILRQ